MKTQQIEKKLEFYEGLFKENLPNGFGKYHWIDGKMYEG